MASPSSKTLPDGRVATGIPGQYLTPEELYRNNSYRTTVAVAFGIALPVVALALRLLARRLRKLALWWDDYMIMLAVVLTIANSCVPIISNKGGNGRHEVTLRKSDLELYFLGLFIFEQTFGAAICAVKLSVLLLYRRIFSTPNFRFWTTIVGLLTIAWFIVKNFVGAFQCQPVRKAWIKDTPGHCPINFIHTVLGAQAFNTLFDIIILIMPIWQISKLNLPLKKRLGVMAIFAVGLFTIIVSLLRLGIIAQEVTAYGPTLPDVTWFTSKFNWTVMDPAVGCFVACMPTWAPLAKPLGKVPGYVTSLRFLVSRKSSGRNKGSRIASPPASNEQLNLGQYQRHNTATVIGKPRLDPTEQLELQPLPGRVEIRKDFSQEESQARPDHDYV